MAGGIIPGGGRNTKKPIQPEAGGPSAPAVNEAVERAAREARATREEFNTRINDLTAEMREGLSRIEHKKPKRGGRIALGVGVGLTTLFSGVAATLGFVNHNQGKETQALINELSNPDTGIPKIMAMLENADTGLPAMMKVLGNVDVNTQNIASMMFDIYAELNQDLSKAVGVTFDYSNQTAPFVYKGGHYKFVDLPKDIQKSVAETLRNKIDGLKVEAMDLDAVMVLWGIKEGDLDINRDGAIDSKDLKAVAEWFKALDPNYDGKIDGKTFLAIANRNPSEVVLSLIGQLRENGELKTDADKQLAQDLEDFINGKVKEIEIPGEGGKGGTTINQGYTDEQLRAALAKQKGELEAAHQADWDAYFKELTAQYQGASPEAQKFFEDLIVSGKEDSINKTKIALEALGELSAENKKLIAEAVLKDAMIVGMKATIVKLNGDIEKLKQELKDRPVIEVGGGGGSYPVYVDRPVYVDKPVYVDNGYEKMYNDLLGKYNELLKGESPDLAALQAELDTVTWQLKDVSNKLVSADQELKDLRAQNSDLNNKLVTEMEKNIGLTNTIEQLEQAAAGAKEHETTIPRGASGGAIIETVDAVTVEIPEEERDSVREQLVTPAPEGQQQGEQQQGEQQQGEQQQGEQQQSEQQQGEQQQGGQQQGEQQQGEQQQGGQQQGGQQQGEQQAPPQSNDTPPSPTTPPPAPEVSIPR